MNNEYDEALKNSKQIQSILDNNKSTNFSSKIIGSSTNNIFSNLDSQKTVKNNKTLPNFLDILAKGKNHNQSEIEDGSRKLSFLKKKSNERPTIKELIEKVNDICLCPKILIVDDNGYNVMVLRVLIETIGFKTDTANSGDEAINKVRRRFEQEKCCKGYYIIFMDIDMPGKDGLVTTTEILNFFRKSSKETGNTFRPPVIIACTAIEEGEYGNRLRRV